MSKAASILIALIAVLHFLIAGVEMFAWTNVGPIVFSQFPKAFFEPTQAMAVNQGIYNAFLAVGLVWSLLINDQAWQHRIATCFLLFVAVAGLVGALTISPRIALVQTAPAIVAWLLLRLKRVDATS